MLGAWRRSLSGTPLAAAVILLALALRVLAPAGFMPDYGSQGLVLRLCSGQGAQSVIIVPGKSTPDDRQQARADACLFAAAPGQDLVLPAELPMAAALLPRLPVVFAKAIAHLTVHRLAAPPPPSQAPPAQA